VWPQFGNFVCALEKLICAEFPVLCTITIIVAHKPNQLLAQKKNIHIGFQTAQPKNIALKDFWRLTPSQWQISSRNTEFPLAASGLLRPVFTMLYILCMSTGKNK
jgi:hypothetical protein